MLRSLPGRSAALAFALSVMTIPAHAALITVPPITVTSLTHTVSGNGVLDAIVIPGPGYNSSGFTAAFGTGDVVRVLIQAPPGKMFVVRPGTSAYGGSFHAITYWQCASGGTSHFNPATVTFENLIGYAPTNTYALAVANDILVETWFDYTTPATFMFTAFRVDIPVDQPLPALPRTYSDVQSYASWAFGAGATSADPNYRAMEIIDISPTAVRSESWGSLKSRYR